MNHKKKAIINANIVLKDHYIPDGIIIMEDGIIKDFDEMRHLPTPKDCEVIDAGGNYAGPGFIDIHTHASDVKFFTDDPYSCAEHHLDHGTTSVYPALYFSMNTEQYVAAIDQMKEAMKDPRGKNIAGVYMEGPYLNPKFGCDKEHCPWKGAVDKKAYQPVIDAAKDVALVWALAPERENIVAFVKDVKAANPDATFSVAHSEAAPWQVEDLMPYGLRIGTHHTDATGKFHQYPDPEILGVGVDEAVNKNDGIWAELICDSRGIHVAPYMLRLVRKIKGEDRIILISDAYAADGPVPEGYDDPFDINFDITGEIAGSKLTLDVAMRNMMNHTGASVCDVFRYATANPAAATGIKDRGEIKRGLKADIVICDDHIHVKKVIMGGEIVRDYAK